MKKLLSIAFCLAMLITLPATAFASDMPTNNVNVRQASINEYEALKALSKESVFRERILICRNLKNTEL